jgi:uncharacterized membrane protein YheB (UPF0754 family)
MDNLTWGWSMIWIPVIAGIIGLITNFAGIKMLFYPVHFKGFVIPGAKALTKLVPRKLQGIPGVPQGAFGWQGVIPSRAAKMGSIAVDKGIAKLGSPAEFYQRLEPDTIAAHILATSGDEVHGLVESIITREHPQLWEDTPSAIKGAIHARIDAQLPALVKRVTDQIGENIEQLLDIKLMVIREIEADPSLANKIFLEVGKKELNFVIWSGLALGFLLGIPAIFVSQVLVNDVGEVLWWVLPVNGIFVGYLTNWIAIKMIFVPIEPKKLGPFTFHGLFMRRQAEVAQVYARVIANDIVTLKNIGIELVSGTRSDRTRYLIEQALRPAVDESLGIARGAVRVAIGTKEYDAIRTRLATEAIDSTMAPLTDPAFNVQQSGKVYELLAGRLAVLSPPEFADMLRSAMEEDEWMLVFIGSVLGFAAGSLQYSLVAAGLL